MDPKGHGFPFLNFASLSASKGFFLFATQVFRTKEQTVSGATRTVTPSSTHAPSRKAQIQQGTQ
jgi:hypothetical protein